VVLDKITETEICENIRVTAKSYRNTKIMKMIAGNKN
jgi:hypothetical protein